MITPKEDLPTHDVVVTFDDAETRGINDPSSWGDYVSCLEFISTHEAPLGWEFAIRDLESGRLVSWQVELAPKRTQVRLGHLYTLED